MDAGPRCSGDTTPREMEGHRCPSARSVIVNANGPSPACVEYLGLGFIDPIHTYSLSDQATKCGLLFVLLRLEQTAMVVGAIALFVVLTSVMLLTHRWTGMRGCNALGRPLRKPGWPRAVPPLGHPKITATYPVSC